MLSYFHILFIISRNYIDILIKCNIIINSMQLNNIHFINIILIIKYLLIIISIIIIIITIYKY